MELIKRLLAILKSVSTASSRSARYIGVWLSPSIVLAIASLGLAAIWLGAVPSGPDSCASILDFPTNCSLSERVQAAILPTVTLIVVAAITMTLTVVHAHSRRVSSIIGPFVVFVVAAGGYLTVSWTPVWAHPA